MGKYEPPYTISNKMLEFVSSISEYDKDRKCIYRLQGEGVCTKENFTIKYAVDYWY